MLRHTLLLLFLYGIRSSTGRPQNELSEAREQIQNHGMRKSEVGANGSGDGGSVLRNFRNPVLEYLLNKDGDSGRKGIIREIRHGQTLLVPLGSPAVGSVPNKEARPVRDPDKDSITNFYDYVNKVGMTAVTSPVLHLNRSEMRGEWTKMETFPAAGVVVSTYNADGTLKSSVTHFRPLGAPSPISGHRVGNPPPQKINWPFAGYFPIVINDPFLAAYNGITSSMYNTFSSVVEYGPEADICREKEVKSGRNEGTEFDEVTLDAEVKLIKPTSEKPPEKNVGNGERRRRDTTGIVMNFKNGDKVSLEVQEPESRSLPKRPMHGDLVLRKGGVAIAGPGGAATAYTGGTAIVGPYGTVYKSPKGTAILGPYSRVVNITDDMSFEEILKLHTGQRKSPNNRAATARKFKTYKNYFSYLTDLPVSIADADKTGSGEGGKVVTMPVVDLVKVASSAVKEGLAEVPQDVAKEERVGKSNETLLVFRPKARAEAGRKGVALSAPISHAILFPNQKAKIKFEPESVASAGPGGFAHAQSDLFLTYFQRRDVLIPAEGEERTRAHSVMLVNPPPLSSIARPAGTGFNIKKKGSKPQRPDKEGEGTSEEVGEEMEDTTNQAGPSDGVAISPPPDGASVAEAKPVGLAIAGPGGVAAAKPQGTAVAGPGGLAIARPIGTAIAGVEVEGAVPIGGQQKNKKKKPKQDPEKMDDEMDTELHYVGGLTGPIGNPQPNTKDFGKGSATAKSRNQENLLIGGNNDGYQLKLEEQDGKYGFFPLMVSPLKGADRIQKRMDTPTFFHGLLGNRNSPQQSQPQIYHNFYY